jgi:ribonuclease G
MNIKTKERNPNQNGEVEAPIVLIDKINAELNKVVKHKHNKGQSIHLHLHPFIAAYLTKGFPSIRFKWWLEHKKWVRVVPRNAYLYLDFRFLNNSGKRLRN